MNANVYDGISTSFIMTKERTYEMDYVICSFDTINKLYDIIH